VPSSFQFPESACLWEAAAWSPEAAEPMMMATHSDDPTSATYIPADFKSSISEKSALETFSGIHHFLKENA
jgi:hypothetical protein